MKSWLLSLCLFCAMIGSTMADEKKQMEETAIFAGGCFWCLEHDLKNIPGVLDVKSGYTGGHVVNPSYEQVSAQKTGHKEAVKVTYDPSKISYGELLENYWHNIDPFDSRGQFCDKGDSYKAVIFYTNEDQRTQAEESKKKLEAEFKQPIATEIVPAAPFYLAEEYHQEYSEKNPIRYKYYRFTCRRDKRLAEVWGKK